MQLIPSSWGSALREFNPCHEPRSGKFARKGTGDCQGGATAQDGVRHDQPIARTTILDTSVLDRVAALTGEGGPAYDLAEALRVAGPAFEVGYRALMVKAIPAQAELTERLTEMVDKLGGKMQPYASITAPGGVFGAMGSVKNARRLIEKAVTDNDGDLSKSRDIVRATVAVDHADDVHKVVKAVRSSFDVVREKGNFHVPTAAGYRDHMFNIRLSNGMIVEIQVHVKPILAVKEGAGHRLYEQARNLVAGSEARARLERQMSKLYTAAWMVASVGMAVNTWNKWK